MNTIVAIELGVSSKIQIIKLKQMYYQLVVSNNNKANYLLVTKEILKYIIAVYLIKHIIYLLATIILLIKLLANKVFRTLLLRTKFQTALFHKTTNLIIMAH
jgi:hypothetical protein